MGGQARVAPDLGRLLLERAPVGVKPGGYLVEWLGQLLLSRGFDGGEEFHGVSLQLGFHDDGEPAYLDRARLCAILQRLVH